MNQPRVRSFHLFPTLLVFLTAYDTPFWFFIRFSTNKRIMRILTVLILLLNVQLVVGQKYSNEFLNIGVSARAQALGGATAASIDDVTAGYWNPAGLAFVTQDPQVSAMHTEWFAGIGTYDYVGVAMPLADGKRTLGVSFIRFGIDDIPNTLSLYESDGTINYDNIVPFSAADYAFLVSYAQPVGTKGLYLGGNVKVVRRVIGPFANSWGFGLDAGVQYRPNNKLRLGATIKDFTNTFNAWRFNFTDAEKETLSITDNEIPINSLEVTHPQIVLGAAYQMYFGDFGVLAETNINLFTDGQRNTLVSANPISIDPILGAEFSYKKFLFFRLGANYLQRETDLTGQEFWGVHPNLGLGMKIRKLYIDYAFTNVGESSDNTFSHVISFKLEVNRDYLKKAMAR